MIEKAFGTFLLAVSVLTFCCIAQSSNGRLDVDRKVLILLKAWGEDVNHSVSHDSNHGACRAILTLGPAAIPPLVRAMQEGSGESRSDAWMRDNAAWVVNLMGSDAWGAKSELIALLEVENPTTQRWAAQILGNIGPDAPEAVPGLLDLLKDESSLTRGIAALALGNIGTEASLAIPAILELLEHSDSEVRRRGIVALGRFGPKAKSAYSKVFEMLRDSSTRKSTAWALTQLAPEGTASIEREIKVLDNLDETRTESAFRDDSGLYCRAIPAVKEIEQGMEFFVELEAWPRPDELPEGVKHMNAFRIQELLKLHLTNLETEQILELDIEANNYPFIPDNGQHASSLDGQMMGPWKAAFRLVRLREALNPGPYECVLELRSPKNRPKYWGNRPELSWEQFGFWSGRIRSQPFGLRVLKETPKIRPIIVPGEPHLEQGASSQFQLVFKKEEFSAIDVRLRNGFYVGYHSRSVDGESNLSSGLPEWTAEDRIHEIPDRVKWPHYRLEVFETASPPGRSWNPYGDASGYKVLWELDFEANLFRGFGENHSGQP